MKGILKNVAKTFSCALLASAMILTFVTSMKNAKKLDNLQEQNSDLIKQVDVLKNDIKTTHSQSAQEEFLETLGDIEKIIDEKNSFTQEDRAQVMQQFEMLEEDIASLVNIGSLTQDEADKVMKEVLEAKVEFVAKNFSTHILALCEKEGALEINNEKTETYVDKYGVIVVGDEDFAIAKNGNFVGGNAALYSDAGINNIGDISSQMYKLLYGDNHSFSTASVPVEYDANRDMFILGVGNHIELCYDFGDNYFEASTYNEKTGESSSTFTRSISQDHYDLQERQYLEVLDGITLE